MKIKKINFNEQVWTVTKKIPRGKVSTYANLAKALGNPSASRAVGNALHRNPYAPGVPCHRVVRSDGSLGGYAGGNQKKAALLRKEGVRIKNEKVDLGTFGYELRLAKA